MAAAERAERRRKHEHALAMRLVAADDPKPLIKYLDTLAD